MIIESPRNALFNCKNPAQGHDKKVLCVCSAGLLRSPTTASVLHKEYGYNTRACGSEPTYALIPISEALVKWADEIVFVNPSNYTAIRDQLPTDKSVVILNIPDNYSYNDPYLREVILAQYQDAVTDPVGV